MSKAKIKVLKLFWTLFPGEEQNCPINLIIEEILSISNLHNETKIYLEELKKLM